MSLNINILVIFDTINCCLLNFYHVQDLFGLPCSTTCDGFKPHKNLQPGYNPDIIHHAVELYKGGPVIDASDEARALRFVKIINDYLELASLDNHCVA